MPVWIYMAHKSKQKFFVGIPGRSNFQSQNLLMNQRLTRSNEEFVFGKIKAD